MNEEVLLVAFLLWQDSMGTLDFVATLALSTAEASSPTF